MLSQGLFKPSSQLFMAFSLQNLAVSEEGVWKAAFPFWCTRAEKEHSVHPFGLLGARNVNANPHKWGAEQTWTRLLCSNISCFFPLQSEETFLFFFPQATSLSKLEFFFQHLSKFKHHNERAEKKTRLSRELLGWQQFQVAVCGNALFLQSWIPRSVGFLQLERQQLVHMCGEEIPGSQSLLLWGQTFFECCLMPVQMKSADCGVIW